MVVDAFPYAPLYTDPDSSLASVADVGAVPLPSWVTLDPSTGQLSGTPPASGSTISTGPHRLRFYDGTNNVDSNEFYITVPGVAGAVAFEEIYEFAGGWDETTSARASLSSAALAFEEIYEFAGGWDETTSARASLSSAALAFTEDYDTGWDGTP